MKLKPIRLDVRSGLILEVEFFNMIYSLLNQKTFVNPLSPAFRVSRSAPALGRTSPRSILGPVWLFPVFPAFPACWNDYSSQGFKRLQGDEFPITEVYAISMAEFVLNTTLPVGFFIQRRRSRTAIGRSECFVLTFEFVSMEMLGAKEPMASSSFLRCGTSLGPVRNSDFIWVFWGF